VALTISLFSKPTFLKIVVFATLICFVYSILDEYHQTMVVGRVGSIIDCIIDTSGAMVGSGLYYLAYRIKQLKK
jgi:VanZ family protein